MKSIFIVLIFIFSKSTFSQTQNDSLNFIQKGLERQAYELKQASGHSLTSRVLSIAGLGIIGFAIIDKSSDKTVFWVLSAGLQILAFVQQSMVNNSLRKAGEAFDSEKYETRKTRIRTPNYQ